MGWFPFANSRFQMGVTVMGFAEHFGHCILVDYEIIIKPCIQGVKLAILIENLKRLKGIENESKKQKGKKLQ